MGTHRVVLDTNVYISGFGWSGNPDECVELVLGGTIEGYSSPEILSELERVLGYDHLSFTPAEQAAFLSAVQDGTTVIQPTEEHEAAVDDPDDHIFIDCAVEANAHYLITGNLDHFPNSYQGIEVISPGEYLRECR